MKIAFISSGGKKNALILTATGHSLHFIRPSRISISVSPTNAKPIKLVLETTTSDFLLGKYPERINLIQTLSARTDRIMTEVTIFVSLQTYNNYNLAIIRHPAFFFLNKSNEDTQKKCCSFRRSEDIC